MFELILKFFPRLRLSRTVFLTGANARFILGPNVRLQIQDGAEIIVEGGCVQLGVWPDLNTSYTSHGQATLILERGSRLIFKGSAVIAPGFSIRVKESATLEIGSHARIAQNFFCICSKEIRIGRGACFSWNLTLIDDDGHVATNRTGRAIRGFRKSLLIGENVGIQMNVAVPRGVTIGNNSIVGSGTVLREDVPGDCMAYSRSFMKFNHNVRISF